jgi:hypothetical protein
VCVVRIRTLCDGGRDFDALFAWAKENLGPSCGAENVDLCNDEQKGMLKAWPGLGSGLRV